MWIGNDPTVSCALCLTHSLINIILTHQQRQGLRKNLSLIELSGSKRGELGEEDGGVPEPTQSPTATAVSWQQYVVRITEDEEEGVFF